MITKKITKIEIQKKRKNRCSVYLDNEFAFGLDQEIVFKFGLRKGDQLSENDIEDILLLEEKKVAKERALKFLAYRDRSEKEIIDKLKDIGYKNSIVEWVISELKRMKLIDDTRFAISFAKTKMVTKPMGEYLLRRELINKGICDKYIALAIDQVYKEQDQRSLATELAKKQMKRYVNLDDRKTKKRICDLLLRRGFNWEVINDVVERLDV